MKNEENDMRRILNTKEMQLYLNRIRTGNSVRLTPEGWEVFQVESGMPEQGYERMYFNACYSIPHETAFKMSVEASQADNTSDIEVAVYITHPQILRCDGKTHGLYEVVLELVTGTVKEKSVFESHIPELIGMD